MRIAVNLPDVTREELAEEGHGVELPEEGSLTLYYRVGSSEEDSSDTELRYVLRWANFVTGKGRVALYLTEEEFGHLAEEVVAEVGRKAKRGQGV